MPKAKSLPINRNTKRHGKAAAVAFIHALERFNALDVGKPGYGEPGERERTDTAIGAYLAGYAQATPRAQSGFRFTFGEFMACAIGCGSLESELLATAKEMREPALTDAERNAHARAWLKGGSV